MIRSTIFWIHLVCGVVTGVVVLMMSVTGVLLTYERQILAYAERQSFPIEADGAARLPLEAILASARQQRPEFSPATILVTNDPDAPITLGGGRSGSLFANPYTGDVAEPGAQGLHEFFDDVTGWHRWFNVEGEGRATARAITGASNVAFLFLVLSGMYLWLPRVWKWAAFKAHLLFNAKATTSKARDFNWHHVFGIWSAVPLAVVVATATVFSYPWANNLVYRAFGEEPPARGGGGSGGRGQQTAAAAPITEWGHGTGLSVLGLDALFERAAAHGNWRTLTLTLPTDASATTVRFAIDAGNGGQPQLRHTLTLDATNGAVAAYVPFSSQTPGQQARLWVRFLHTGEALGIVGQTIAGIVSFTSLIMVWTGIALAWRRLVSPLFRRRPATR
jgi:uncharacterized iron-regulated membrane protein